MKIIASDAEKQVRLDKFLLTKITNISRSQLGQAIEAGVVLINKKKVLKHHFLKPNHVIEIDEDKLKKFKDDHKLFKLKPNKKIKIDIVFEDNNYLVINKPSGIIVHPSEIHQENDTLINGVLAHCPDIVKISENPLRPGIVHRLDKEVSGLMVIAKTQTAFDDLKKQFQSREIYKEYVTLVHGIPKTKHDFIKFAITRSKQVYYKMAAQPANSESGQEAVTEYEVVQEFKNYALLKVILHTGRTHQIRAHLLALGFPIVGDQLYITKQFKSHLNIDRIFLHAQELRFNSLNKEILTFKQPLPKELASILTKI